LCQALAPLIAEDRRSAASGCDRHSISMADPWLLEDFRWPAGEGEAPAEPPVRAWPQVFAPVGGD